MSKKELQLSLQELDWEEEGGELLLGSMFSQREEEITTEPTRQLAASPLRSENQGMVDGSVTLAEVLAEDWEVIRFAPELDGTPVLYDDGQVISHNFVLSGNGMGVTILRGTDGQGAFFAQGNQLTVQNLTWEGDLYAGAKDGDTNSTHLELQNVVFTGNLFGSSNEQSQPYNDNGNVELTLSNSTFTAGSCIFGSAAVTKRSAQKDVDSHIVIDADCTGEKAKFYGGGLVLNTGILTTDDMLIEVQGGTWGQFFGGSRLGEKNSLGFYIAENCVITVTDGLFLNWLATGSQARNGTSEQNDATLNISGGTFNNIATGGVAMGGTLRLYGDATLNISGGTFCGYVFGGSGANTVKNSSKSTISGSSRINIDATENRIRFEKNIYAGCFGKGRTMKGTTITFRGLGENLSFAEDVVISGSNQSAMDNSRAVYQERELHFQEFTGTLSCNIGRSFTSIAVSASCVEFGGSSLVDAVPAWDLELFSSSPELTFGEKTVNDFTGDKLTVSWADGLLPVGEQWQLIAATTPSQLKGWNAFASVTLAGETATFTDGAWSSDSYSLTKQGNSLCVGTSRL